MGASYEFWSRVDLRRVKEGPADGSLLASRDMPHFHSPVRLLWGLWRANKVTWSYLAFLVLTKKFTKTFRNASEVYEIQKKTVLFFGWRSHHCLSLKNVLGKLMMKSKNIRSYMERFVLVLYNPIIFVGL